MRTVVAALIVVVLVGAVVAVSGREAGSTYRVDAVFDTAKGMVAGQQVKIAGAVVGTIAAVELAPGPKALVKMEIEERFRPFRADASCRIRPEGLISENYVECSAGSPKAEPLSARGAAPTIPVERTEAPVSLQDVINVFALPTAKRLQVVISEMGLGTAARGADVNALLRRANPALTQANHVLAILERQRATLQRAVSETDRVVDRLARRDDDLRRFVAGAARVTTRTGRRRRALSDAIRDLPGMLDQLRSGLRDVDRAAEDSTPLLRGLRDAGGQLASLTAEIPQFTATAAPALRALRPAAETTRRASVSTRRVASELLKTVGDLEPFAADLETLMVTTRDQGGFEGLLRQAYSLANVASAYDSTSHILSLLASVFPKCFATSNLPGCSHRYNSPGQGTIPVNNPDCGPRGGAPWDAPTDCASNPARNRVSGRDRKPAPTIHHRRERSPSLPGPVGKPSLPDRVKPELLDTLRDLLPTLPKRGLKPLGAEPATRENLVPLLDWLLK